jgi:hypothetical protein
VPIHFHYFQVDLKLKSSIATYWEIIPTLMMYCFFLDWCLLRDGSRFSDPVYNCNIFVVEKLLINKNAKVDCDEIWKIIATFGLLDVHTGHIKMVYTKYIKAHIAKILKYPFNKVMRAWSDRKLEAKSKLSHPLMALESRGQMRSHAGCWDQKRSWGPRWIIIGVAIGRGW